MNKIISSGYDPDFLKKKLSFPGFDLNNCAPLLKGSSTEIKYTHFSLFLHRVRKLPLLAAVNIKGEEYNAQPREKRDDWDYSNQIDEKFQIDNSFYAKDDNTFDRGHMIRRVDPCWGDDETCIQADKDTFKWANCTPQHKKLNQKGGVWFELEQHVIENGVKEKQMADISVFCGPVLDPADLNFIKPYKDAPIQIPSVFWKVIVWKKKDGELYAVGFMMSQWEFIKQKLFNGPKMERVMVGLKDELPHDYFENLKFSDHKTYQVPLSEITKATDIEFWNDVKQPFNIAKPEIVVLANTGGAQKTNFANGIASVKEAAKKTVQLQNIIL